jgi:hypothetical protein
VLEREVNGVAERAGVENLWEYTLDPPREKMRTPREHRREGVSAVTAITAIYRRLL